MNNYKLSDLRQTPERDTTIQQRYSINVLLRLGSSGNDLELRVPEVFQNKIYNFK